MSSSVSKTGSETLPSSEVKRRQIRKYCNPAPVEVKMGEGEIEEAAANLRKLAGIVDPVKTGAPSFMMVLTGTPFAYRRPDGVIVCPLGCLRP